MSWVHWSCARYLRSTWFATTHSSVTWIKSCHCSHCWYYLYGKKILINAYYLYFCSHFLFFWSYFFLFSMWKHIGDNPRYVLLDDMSSRSTDNHGEVSRQPLDWSSSSFGLFMGLLSLVALIINLIVYFALVDQVLKGVCWGTNLRSNFKKKYY